MNTRIWDLTIYEMRRILLLLSRSYQVCLELVEVHIESSVKPEAGCDGGDDLGNQPVQVGVGRSLHSQVVVAQIVNGLNVP